MSVIVDGKTKIIKRGPTDDTVVVEAKDVLTGGDAEVRMPVENIGVEKTEQAANVFSLLNRQEIPTAFIERLSPRELLCHRCEMLPMELIVRRYAWGTYLLRHPECSGPDGDAVRFDVPVYELFHKQSVIAAPITEAPYQMDEETAREQFMRDGAWADGVYTDPYILPGEREWTLYSAKRPLTEALMSVPPICSSEERLKVVYSLLIPTFVILEKAWSKVETIHGPVVLADMKLEVGRRASDGELVIGDVIDNDGWRIWPGGDRSKQLDEQCFRDGHPVSSVAENYSLVTALTTQLAG